MDATLKKELLEDLFSRYEGLRSSEKEILEAYDLLENVFRRDGTLFLCGNGGSSSDADHIVGELGKGFLLKRKLSPEKTAEMSQALGEDASELASKLQMAFKAVSLNSQPALSSAFVNDVDPLMSYAQLLFALGRKGDALLGISTSGNAKNVMNAMRVARACGISTVLLTGKNHGLCEKYADRIIHVPASETYQIQEYHLPVYHELCIMLEREFFGK